MRPHPLLRPFRCSPQVPGGASQELLRFPRLERATAALPFLSGSGPAWALTPTATPITAQIVQTRRNKLMPRLRGPLCNQNSNTSVHGLLVSLRPAGRAPQKKPRHGLEPKGSPVRLYRISIGASRPPAAATRFITPPMHRLCAYGLLSTTCRDAFLKPEVKHRFVHVGVDLIAPVLIVVFRFAPNAPAN